MIINNNILIHQEGNTAPFRTINRNNNAVFDISETYPLSIMKKTFCLVLLLLLVFSTAGCTFTPPFDITMPYSSDEYKNGDWTGEGLIAHFEELGFHNITASPEPSYFGDYENAIIDVTIEGNDNDSILPYYKAFQKGDIVNSADEIRISYYYVPDALTINESPELAEILFGKEDGKPIDYMLYANILDGKHVRFDACVSYHSTYSPIIEVGGGDTTTSSGCTIRMGDIALDNQIDESVEIGQCVKVYGKIDASWSEYYDLLFIDTLALQPR